MEEIQQQYTVPQVADKLQVSEATVWREISLGKRTSGAEGIYPVNKLGPRRLRVPAGSVNRYLARKSVVVV